MRPGSNAEGGPGNDLIPAAPDLTDKEWKHGSTDGEIFSAIKNGVPPELNMIPFADQLKDTEMWNVVNYIRSLAKRTRDEGWMGRRGWIGWKENLRQFFHPAHPARPARRACSHSSDTLPEGTHFDNGSGRTWNLTSLLVVPLPPSM